MLRILTAATLVLLALYGKAQKVIDITTSDETGIRDYHGNSAVSGQLYTGIKYVRVTAGTPFFKEQFMKAQLTDNGGGHYRCNAVRINLMDNEINFLGADGKEMICSSPIHHVILLDSASGQKYYFVWGGDLNPTDKLLEKIWFQVLVNDEVSLCRQVKKRIHETPGYGSATTDQDIISIESYYLRIKGGLVPVKSWQDLQDQLQDQKALLTQYIHDHHLKGRSADDYTQLVTAYNAGKKS